MAFLTDLSGALAGSYAGLADDIVKAVSTFLPLSAEQKAAIDATAKQKAMEAEKQQNDAIASSEKAINDRVSLYEGTASELKTIPILGSIMIFLRGGQRILWGYSTLYLDYLWFTSWHLTDKQEAALVIINFLVLGFLFGERAVKNVAPFLTDLLTAKNKGQ